MDIGITEIIIWKCLGKCHDLGAAALDENCLRNAENVLRGDFMWL